MTRTGVKAQGGRMGPHPHPLDHLLTSPLPNEGCSGRYRRSNLELRVVFQVRAVFRRLRPPTAFPRALGYGLHRGLAVPTCREEAAASGGTQQQANWEECRSRSANVVEVRAQGNLVRKFTTVSHCYRP